jgi:hypothetical protein
MKINEMGKANVRSVKDVPVGGVFENENGAFFLKVDEDSYLLIRAADRFINRRCACRELYWHEPGDPPFMTDITDKNTTVKNYYGTLYRIDEITVSN